MSFLILWTKLKVKRNLAITRHTIEFPKVPVIPITFGKTCQGVVQKTNIPTLVIWDISTVCEKYTNFGYKSYQVTNCQAPKRHRGNLCIKASQNDSLSLLIYKNDVCK